VSSFEEAREVFKLGVAYVQRAKAYLELDGFVTDHFTALQLEQTLYQHLGAWEADPARRLAMHRRRLQLLGAVDLINETAYLQLARQARFDLGGIAADILELKQAMHKDDPPARQDKKLAGAVASVVELYDKFAKGFADKQGAPPQSVEEGSEHAYLMAHFHKARALGKLHDVESIGGSLASYQLLVKYFDANPKCEGMSEEAEICREMAELLPRRIDMEANKAAKAKELD